VYILYILCGNFHGLKRGDVLYAGIISIEASNKLHGMGYVCERNDNRLMVDCGS